MRTRLVFCILAPFLLGFMPAIPEQTPVRQVRHAEIGDELWSDQFALPAIDGFVTCAVMFHGDLIIAGRFSQAGGVSAANIARWNGEEWLALGDGLDNDVLSVAVFQDRLVVGGRFSRAGSVQSIGVAEWDGTEWRAMGDGLRIPLQIPQAETSALIEYRGALVATGAFRESGGHAVHGIAIWDGAQWNALGDGLDGSGRALGVWRDSLYVAGYFRTAGATNAGSIAVWDGSGWSGVDSGLTFSGSTARAYSLVVYQDKLIVGGEFDQAGDLTTRNIVSWNGGEWETLGAGLQWGVMALAVHGGKLVVSEAINGESLGEWDGVSWKPGAPLPVGNASCLLSVEDGLVVGGAFQASTTQSGPIRGFQIAKWNGSDWIGFEPWNDRMHGLSSLFGGSPHVQSLASYRGELVAGGFLGLAGNPPEWLRTGTIATWNGDRWRTLGDLDVFGQTYTLLSQRDTLYAGGTLYGYHNGIYATGLWRFDGTAWSMVDTLQATIVSMVMYKDNLYVGARRSGTPAPFSGGVYRWDGRQLISIASTDPGIRAMVVHDGKLIAAGEFTSIGGVTAPGIAAWNGTRWEPLAGTPNPGEIDAFVSWNGSLVAAGRFCGVTGCPSVALLDRGAWSPLGALTDRVSCVTVANRRLFAGGWSTIAQWDSTRWVSLGSGINGQAYALQEHGGSLFVAGGFTQAGAHSSFGIAEWSGLVPLAQPEAPPISRLGAARPSPFEASTRIPLTLMTGGRVRVTIHDASGRKIVTLKDGELPAGEHMVDWNGRDDRGRRAPSGVYFVRAVVAGGLHFTRKIAHLR
jgi:hypothetical protein